MKKYIGLIILGLSTSFLIFACSPSKNSSDNVYVYGGDKDIRINLKNDYSFSYYVDGEVLGEGNWKEKDEIATLTENNGKVYHVDKFSNLLMYQAKDSDDFYEVKDGEYFGISSEYFVDAYAEKGGLYSIEGNTITAFSGSNINFSTVTKKRYGYEIIVENINIISSHKLDNVVEFSQDETGFMLFRKNGKISRMSLHPETNSLTITHSGPDDEAEIEVVGKKDDGGKYREKYIIRYYCNCG